MKPIVKNGCRASEVVAGDAERIQDLMILRPRREIESFMAEGYKYGVDIVHKAYEGELKKSLRLRLLHHRRYEGMKC